MDKRGESGVAEAPASDIGAKQPWWHVRQSLLLLLVIAICIVGGFLFISFTLGDAYIDIGGTVTDSQGDAVADADVKLIIGFRSPARMPKEIAAKTSSDGRYFVGYSHKPSSVEGVDQL